MIDIIKEPWPWYIAGPLISSIMFLLLYFNKSFGVSSSLETLCTIGGAGKWSSYFKSDWKNNLWNLIFVLGAVIGGFIASHYLTNDDSVALNNYTIEVLQGYGISNPGEEYLPTQLFNWQNLLEAKGFVLMIIGGFMIGFGTRYAGGCTSGHAISGLSNLQFPSLLAVIGFFVGGLITVHLIFPILF